MSIENNEIFWFGEDIWGNKYCSCTDKSHEDFWVETVIKKDKQGKLTIYSCDIFPKEKEQKDAS